MRPLLLIVIVLLALAVLPVWPHSVGWSLFPSGLLLTVVCIILLLWLFSSRRLPPI